MGAGFTGTAEASAASCWRRVRKSVESAIMRWLILQLRV
jgi:hypothetical protein